MYVHISQNSAGPWLQRGDPMKPQPNGSKNQLHSKPLQFSTHTQCSLGDRISKCRKRQSSQVVISGTMGRVGGLGQLERESPEDPVQKHPGRQEKIPEKVKVGAQSRVVQIADGI